MNQDRPPAPEPLAKRRRGRPRKDESLPPKEKPVPASNYLKNIIHQVDIKPVDDNQDNVNQENQNEMLGQQVSGVIEGSFDSGYLLAVKMPPPNDNVLRGVVFHPERVCSVSSVNDVAPLVKMHSRKELPVPNMVLPENVNQPEPELVPEPDTTGKIISGPVVITESENKNTQNQFQDDLPNMERIVESVHVQNQNQNQNQNQFEDVMQNQTFPIGNSFITMMTSDSSFPAANPPFVMNQESQSGPTSCLGEEQQQTLERLFSPHLQQGQNRDGLEEVGVGVGIGVAGGERLMEERVDSDRREVVDGIEGEGKGVQDQESGGGNCC